jgi:hypothetical protein
MRIAIIAVPRFAPDDLAWIDRIRSRYDPQRNVVAPHFTLVFPCNAEPVDVVLERAAHVASQTVPVGFVLRSALAVKDTFTAASHVFLIPDEGSSAVVALHSSSILVSLRRSLGRTSSSRHMSPSPRLKNSRRPQRWRTT